MEEVALGLLAVSGVRELAVEVTSWVDRGLVDHVALYRVWDGRKRRLGAAGLPEGWYLEAPNQEPWLTLAVEPEAVVPDRPGDRVHRLLDGDGVLVGGLLLPAGSPLARWAPHVARVLVRAVAADAGHLRAAILDNLLELVRDGVIVANPDGDLLAYSASLEALTGWSADDVRRLGWTNLVYADPTVRADVQRGIAALLRGWPSEGIVRTLARKDGADARVGIWSRAVSDPGGGAPALLGLMRDVTSDEEARKRSAREEGLSQLGRIAGRIAHEYNNLLCAVMGHAELIEASAELPEAARRRAGTIVRSARRGAHLSSRLLAFTGTAQSRPERVDVAELVGQVRELYGPRLPHGVHLVVAAPPGECFAEVDPTQLQQALMNLVVNGAESMHFGGELHVRVRQAPLPTDVRYLAPQVPPPGTPMVEIRVVDQGAGFSPAAFTHLFEPFFTEKRDGHGMGLPAVRGMLAAHGGAAHVENGAPPTGAIITLWLPLSDRPEAPLPDLRRPASVLPQRVWILDDQVSVLEFSRVSLEAEGVQVEVFSSVSSLFANLGSHAVPDLFVFDVQLPDGDGPSALAMLRAAGFEAPVVWITGHTPDSMVMPAGPVLQKPYTGADLVHAVLRARPD